MDRQRLCEVLCHGLTLCIDEMSNASTAAGRAAESEWPRLTKCLDELRDTQAKLQLVLAGRSITTDQAFWFNLDDALYALEEITSVLEDVAELERVREGIADWQNELAATHAVGSARTAA